jgi:GTPase
MPSQWYNTNMLIDRVNIIVHAGNGGNGAVSFRRDGQTAKGGPDGGNGGNGGSIFIQGSHNLTDLREFRYKKIIEAKDGVDGKRSNLYGRNAPDITFYVPLGTRVTVLDTQTVYEIENESRPIRIAYGGKGGRGNVEFKSATNQTPRYAEKGEPGQEKSLFLELRLIAEIGLIGLPNAGKSSLLSVLTNATPQIGAYPFTTLQPNIGMLGTHALADIPGLIEGASEGKGLGTTFLKHIEKTKILVHCIDVSATDLLNSYETVRREFESFNPALLEKTEIIALNKIDLVEAPVLDEAKKIFKNKAKTIVSCSIYEPKSIEKLKKLLVTELEKN